MGYKLFNIKPETGQYRWKESRATIAAENYKTFLSIDDNSETLDAYYLRNLDFGNK